MKWVFGSQPYVMVENYMLPLVELGVGHIRRVAPGETFNFDANKNYPVYIDEPLMILSLITLFETQPWTQRKMWLKLSLSSTHTKSSVGFTFEEMAMMVLMEKFGGK